MTTESLDNKENERLQVRVEEEQAGQRLDRWLTDQLDGYSRSRLKNILEAGFLQKDGTPFSNASWKIRVGEEYELTLPPLEDPTPQPENIPLEILFEDDHLLVLNKAVGMVVHPSPGNWEGTLVNALLYHCRDSLSGIGGVARPGIVHRLDKDTSGVMVIAKHDAIHQALTKRFSVHDMHRVYHAIVHSSPRPGFGTIETGLARMPNDRKKQVAVDMSTRPDAKHAITHYKCLENYGRERAKMPGDYLASLIQCQLETGRTHQIRVHMAHIGHPLLGDPLYGRAPGLAGLKPGDPLADQALPIVKAFTRQALHARELGFTHPISGEELMFETPPPEDFKILQKTLATL